MVAHRAERGIVRDTKAPIPISQGRPMPHEPTMHPHNDFPGVAQPASAVSSEQFWGALIGAVVGAIAGFLTGDD